jgi:hypothetical protein
VGDAVIAGIEFAREDTWTFIFTASFVLALTLLILKVSVNVLVYNPVSRRKGEYDSEREKAAKEANPKLPFNNKGNGDEDGR